MPSGKHVFVIYFVGFDDTDLEPYVGCERIETNTDDAEAERADAEMAALLRGGQVLAITTDDADYAEQVRKTCENEVLRRR
jgi:hypothetical protein